MRNPDSNPNSWSILQLILLLPLDLNLSEKKEKKKSKKKNDKEKGHQKRSSSDPGIIQNAPPQCKGFF